MNAKNKIHLLFFTDRPDLFTEIFDLSNLGERELGCWAQSNEFSCPTANIFKSNAGDYYFINPSTDYFIYRETKRIVIHKVTAYDNLGLESFLREDLDDNLMKHLLFNIDILEQIFIT
jgi:hypothetical protein